MSDLLRLVTKFLWTRDTNSTYKFVPKKKKEKLQKSASVRVGNTSRKNEREGRQKNFFQQKIKMKKR